MCLWLHALVVIRLPALTVTLTYALIQMVKKIAGKSDKARMITKARVTELIMSGGACLMNVWISAGKTVLFDPTTVECCAEQLHEVKAPD